MVIGLPLSTWQQPMQRVSQAPGTNGKLLQEFIPLRRPCPPRPSAIALQTCRETDALPTTNDVTKAFGSSSAYLEFVMRMKD